MVTKDISLRVFKFDGIRALILIDKFDSKDELIEKFNKSSSDRIITEVTLEKQDDPIIAKQFPIVLCLYTKLKEEK